MAGFWQVRCRFSATRNELCQGDAGELNQNKPAMQNIPNDRPAQNRLKRSSPQMRIFPWLQFNMRSGQNRLDDDDRQI